MNRRPLLVGVLVIVVGVALVLFGTQRGADPVSTAPTAPTAPAATSDAERTDSASELPSRGAAPSDGLTPPAGESPATDATPEATDPAATAAPGDTTGRPGSQARRATAEPPQAAAPPAASGIQLVIPGIGLRESLHAEGLRGGRINPPARTVMWYTGNNRVQPGQVGTAVIAGHVVSHGSGDAFANLGNVSVGDRIELGGSAGGAYRVVRAGVVDKHALTTDQDVWGHNSSVRRLAIITCDDAYGFRSDGHRVANYVVIAEPA